jgi:SagB-type dehydrogenase family enzyme
MLLRKQFNFDGKPIDPSPFSISEIFHENTKLRRLSNIQPKSDITYGFGGDEHEMISKSFKRYLTAPSIKLSTVSEEINISLENVLLKRRSIREYSEEPLTLYELSKILYLSCGITDKRKMTKDNIHFLRSYPSAGGLCPLEIYLVMFKDNQINDGLYHYNVFNNTLELLAKGDFKEIISSKILFPEIVLNSKAVLLITAVFPRTLSKYGERGYRFVLLEGGHLAQNIYLIATALNIGTVAIGGFIDDELNEFLQVDGINESVIYALTLGKLSNINTFKSYSE